MILVDYFLAALAWLGRQGTRSVAISIFVGLALPQLAAVMKPYLGLTVFLLLTLSILRVDLGHLRDYFRAPGLIGSAALWIMVALPAVIGGLLSLSGLQQAMPQLYLVLILQIAAAPITSAPAFASLMGLDVALSLGVLLFSTVLTPLTTPAFAYLFVGSAIISPFELGLRALAFYAVAGITAALLFKFVGKPALDRHKDHIDGINVVAVFIFAVAAMDGVAQQLWDAPLIGLLFVVVTFALTAAMTLFTAFVFLRAGRARALAIGIEGGSRNLGALMAVIGVANIPDQVWLYFALSQFPIYLAPQLLKPLVRRFRPPESAPPSAQNPT